MNQYPATFANPGHSAKIIVESDTDITKAASGLRVSGKVIEVHSSSPLRHMKGVTRDFTVMTPACEREDGAGPYLI